MWAANNWTDLRTTKLEHDQAAAATQLVQDAGKRWTRSKRSHALVDWNWNEKGASGDAG